MMPSLLGGQLSFRRFPDAAVALADIRAGKLIPLAIIEHAPSSQGADLRRGRISGPGNLQLLQAVAPAGTPAAIVARMSAEIARAMKSPVFAQKLEHETLIPVFDRRSSTRSPEKGRAAWEAVIRRNAIVRTSE